MRFDHRKAGRLTELWRVRFDCRTTRRRLVEVRSVRVKRVGDFQSFEERVWTTAKCVRLVEVRSVRFNHRKACYGIAEL